MQTNTNTPTDTLEVKQWKTRRKGAISIWDPKIIRAAIPEARIGRRFAVVLNALTVSLPASRVPALLGSPAVTKVYPSVAYTLALDHSPR